MKMVSDILNTSKNQLSIIRRPHRMSGPDAARPHCRLHFFLTLLTLEWTPLICCFMLDESKNALLQISHLKGFIPECLLMCFKRFPELVKSLPQTEHACRLARLCVFRCFDSENSVRKFFSQNLHLKGFSPVCSLLWICNKDLHINVLPHHSHRQLFLSLTTL